MSAETDASEAFVRTDWDDTIRADAGDSVVPVTVTEIKQSG